VINAKVEGQEIVAPEPAAESTNLVDLMKLLEASVKQATDQKSEPVSVAQAKKERASRPKAAETKPASKTTTRKAAKAKDAEEEAEEARPARRRKAS